MPTTPTNDDDDDGDSSTRLCRCELRCIRRVLCAVQSAAWSRRHSFHQKPPPCPVVESVSGPDVLFRVHPKHIDFAVAVCIAPSDTKEQGFGGMALWFADDAL